MNVSEDASRYALGRCNDSRLGGGALWVDWNFYDRPWFLHGFGIEVEGRDLNYGRSSHAEKYEPNLRQDTASGGVIYRFRHYPRFDPYAKFLVGFGSIDFNLNVPNYRHDTRTVYTPGGGLEYRAFRNVWVRSDYEYQAWTNFIRGHTMDPNGVTIGAEYEFR